MTGKRKRAARASREMAWWNGMVIKTRCIAQGFPVPNKPYGFCGRSAACLLTGVATDWRFPTTCIKTINHSRVCFIILILFHKHYAWKVVPLKAGILWGATTSKPYSCQYPFAQISLWAHWQTHSSKHAHIYAPTPPNTHTRTHTYTLTLTHSHLTV